METVHCIARDGVSTAARIAGSAGPPLMFVHGVGSTAAIWDEQLRAFGERYRCIAIELRGNGVPKPEPDPASITRGGYALDVLAVIEALRIDRFTIVGCSLGGVVAFELWERVPERVQAMAIVGSFACYPGGQTYATSVTAAVLEAGDMRRFAASRAAKLGLPPERTLETVEQMACKETASYLAATQATWTGDYRHLLSSIDVPVLVACGERDTIAPHGLSEEIARGIPHAELATVCDAGHVANADAPQAFNALLDGFLRSATGSTRI